jgi:hypothetical protein
VKPGPIGTPGEILQRIAREHAYSFASMTRMLRRRRGYLADFVREGHLATLPAVDRKLLAAIFRVPAWWFGEDLADAQRLVRSRPGAAEVAHGAFLGSGGCHGRNAWDQHHPGHRDRDMELVV